MKKTFGNLEFEWRPEGATRSQKERGHWFAPIAGHTGSEFRVYEPVSGGKACWTVEDGVAMQDWQLSSNDQVGRLVNERLVHYRARAWRVPAS